MKIEIDEEYNFVLKEVHNSVILETNEGNRFAICMRDDTVEMKVLPHGEWHRAEMDTGEIKEMWPSPS